jgi:hypothetical protein
MITSLTAEQKARFPEFVQKWIAIGLSTKPADRQRAEKAIAGLYRLANLKEPRVIWLPCPISAALSAIVYAQITAHRRIAKNEPVGSAVGSAVRSAVGSAVGSAVESAVYSAVRSAVDSAAGSAVGSAGYAFFGGSVWSSGYSAWADYFNEVCAVAIDRNYLEITESAGFYWVLDGICFVSDRPAKIWRDAAGRLHAETGKAISYSGTGWGLYAWHGYLIPDDHAWIITDKAKITAEAILTEPNAELRRVMCEITAFEPIRKLAKTVSKDVDGNGHPRRLLIVNVKDEALRIIEVVNGSIEPDGTRRKFLLGAMPGKTPHEVIAASYGINPKHYREAVRT